MDGQRFDELTRRLARGASRRSVVKGIAASLTGGIAMMLGRSSTEARPVSQAACGNVVCADDPDICHGGCVCCEFGNGNSRCMPPSDCQRLRGDLVCQSDQTPCGNGCCDAGVLCSAAGHCCVGPGTGAAGDFCRDESDCCSGMCNDYTSRCFDHCLPSGAPAIDPPDCCSGEIVADSTCPAGYAYCCA